MKLSQIQTFIKTTLVLVVLFAGTRVASSSAFNITSQVSGDDAGESFIAEEGPVEEEARIEDFIESREQEPPAARSLDNPPISVSDLSQQAFSDHDICAEAWRIQLDIVPQWLQTPLLAEQLHTEFAYTLLSGRLIANGVVDASECFNNGLLFNGAADACGLEKARTAQVAWQNQFDEAILIAARENRIPAYLLKRLFAKETQFWPGTTWLIWEYGIGQATSYGLDPLFQYYPSFYQSICPSIFTEDTCKKGYADLSPEDQALMRGYMATYFVSADCETCEAGIDIARVIATIDIFAKLLVANCHQVNQIFVNLTEDPGAKSSNYEDLWRFTLANYNAGAGCLSDAIEGIVEDEDEVSWVNVANNLIDLGFDCARSIDYVYEISR